MRHYLDREGIPNVSKKKNSERKVSDSSKEGKEKGRMVYP